MCLCNILFRFLHQSYGVPVFNLDPVAMNRPAQEFLPFWVTRFELHLYEQISLLTTFPSIPFLIF